MQKQTQGSNTLDYIVKNYKQHEVGFVIPDEEADVPVNLDLYLMYETSDIEWNEVQTMMFWYFNDLYEKYKSKQISDEKLLELLHFPEVKELGFGHCMKGIEGAGTAKKRARLLKESIFDNPDISKIGLSALAKLVIQIDGYGPDLLSDMTAAFALDGLIRYTNEQIETYQLKTISVSLQRGFDFRTKEWKPRINVQLPYFGDGNCRLLAPRHIVRRMPILSTDEFYKGFLKYILQNEAVSQSQTIGTLGKIPKVAIKDLESRLEAEYESITAATRSIATDRPSLVDQYVVNPHKFDSKRRPRKQKIDFDAYIEEIKNLKAGKETSHEYSRLMLKVFNALYGQNLLRGKIETKSVDGVYRYDINFLNASYTSFFKVLQNANITAACIIIEAKNYDKTDVGNKEFNQGLAYSLRDRREFIFLLQRDDVEKSDIDRAKNMYIRHGVIVFPISDRDILAMIDLRKKEESDFDSILEERLQAILTA